MLPVLLLIAGLVTWFVTDYDAVGIALTVIGGVLLAFQLVFMAIGAAMAYIIARDMQSDQQTKAHYPRQPKRIRGRRQV